MNRAAAPRPLLVTAAAAAIVAAVLLAGCAVSGDATEDASLSTSSQGPVTPSSSTGGSLIPSPVLAFAADTVAEVVVNGLTVRSAPGVAASPVPCDRNNGAPLRLVAGDVVWVLDKQPVVVDGYSWYHTVVDGTPDCHEVPTLPGWIAAGPTDDPWLIPLDACPATPTTVAELGAVEQQPLLALACFSPIEITIDGLYPAPPEGGIGFSCPGISPNWLTCGISMIRSDASALTVRIPPTVTMPAAGQQITVTGHFDDAAGQQCIPADPTYIGQVQATFYCRTQFVISSARPLGSGS